MTRVAQHYRRWPFPGVDHESREGLILLRTLHRWLDGAAEGRRIVDIGCGTGQTVTRLARHFPSTEFVGLDFVAENVASAERSAREAGVENVSFLEVDFERHVPTDLGEFDVLLCLGVLHHLTDLRAGFDRCYSLLSPGGHLVLWLYGKLGRSRHRANQQFLALLGSGLSDDSRLTLARAFVQEHGERFALDTGFYTPRGSGREGLEWLLEHPQWLADQMIPAVEHLVTLSDILTLFDSHDIAIEKWLGVDPDPKAYVTDPLLLERAEQLPPREWLRALDLLIKPAYYFVAGQRRETAR